MDKFAKYSPTSNFPASKGSALQFGATTKGDRVLGTVEMVTQSSPKPSPGSSKSPFDWAAKTFMQLDDAELGGILSVLRGRTKEVKIIHKHPVDGPENKQTTSSLTVTNVESGDVGVNMQQKKPGETTFTRNTIFLKPDEQEVLIILFTEIIKRMYHTEDSNLSMRLPQRQNVEQGNE